MNSISKVAGEVKASTQVEAGGIYPPDNFRPDVGCQEVPALCLDETAKAFARTETGFGCLVIQRIMPPRPCSVVHCGNCNDNKGVWLQSLKDPQSYPHAGFLHTYHEGSYWKIISSKVFPCPSCSTRDDLYAYLWSTSGLLPEQRSWRASYIDGKIGKENAYRTCVDMLADFPRPAGLVLFYGPHGMGKTGLLRSMVAQCCVAGVSACYVRASDILAQFRSSYGDKSQYDEVEIFSLFGSYQLLAIDEVDVINTTSWAETTMRAMLDMRYDRRGRQATLLATNLQPDQLWPYLASRWEDGLRISVSGEDLRGQKHVDLSWQDRPDM